MAGLAVGWASHGLCWPGLGWAWRGWCGLGWYTGPFIAIIMGCYIGLRIHITLGCYGGLCIAIKVCWYESIFLCHNGLLWRPLYIHKVNSYGCLYFAM
jgi:hypothetical protein